MRRSWAAAALVVLALALTVGLVLAAGGSTAGPRARLAFVTGGTTSRSQVWLAAPDGRQRRDLGPGQRPLLAPSGTLVSASANGQQGPALTVYSSAGAPRHFLDAARVDADPLSWSPDSRYLAVALTGRDLLSAAGSGLAVIDVATGRARIVATGAVHGASFARDGSDRIAFGIARSPLMSAPVDLEVVNADGMHRRSLTDDGASLNPVWGPNGIAYDREHQRRDALPAYSVWLLSPADGRTRQLAFVAPPPLRSGLVPLAFDSSGARLLAAYQGADTDEAWTIVVGSGVAHRLLVSGQSVAPAGISSTGASVLADRGGFLEPPSAGTVESVPFAGGAARALVAGAAEPSWNL